ncbi:biotin/lipoyl-binding protein [bacterium]|nr:biotin/lipoyl-binding protein [bacterium]
MPIEVKLAKVSPTMESGQIVKWLVKVGDKVKEGDTIAEVQTDKAVMPMETFDEGTVARIDVAEGVDIPLGARILVLAKKGEDPKQVAESVGGAGAAPSAASAPAASAAPAAAVSAAPVAVASHASGRVKSSPLARKIAESAGVDIASIPGSGPAGRIVRADVEAFVANGTKAAPAAAVAKTPAPVAKAKVFIPLGEDQNIPLDRMRQAIARGMVAAKTQAPEIHVTVDIRMDEVVRVRERLNKALAAEGVKLSVGDFVTKAVAMSLRRHPAVNATFNGDNANLAQAYVTRHAAVNVGIAVALDGGLIVPVLRNADMYGLRDIRVESEKLYEAARSGRLTADQMSGGTFTISNLGMYGVKQFDAVLALPQVAILAVASAEKRPIVVGDQITVGTMMSVTLTADHRAVDGASAAEFLRSLKGFLEEPTAMLL